MAQLPDGAWIEATAASTGVEARVLRAYAGAALRLEREQPGCRLGWNTLAAIGAVESEHGTIDGSVVTDDGVADPPIVDDAALAAARYLCHGERDLTRGPDWVAAISSYNEGSEYHARVLEQARSLASLAAR